ncbi:MAG: nucleotidyltransferase family protein [Planctomycetota bacterium]
MKREAVVAILTEHLEQLRDEYGVRQLLLFGSVARDEAGPGSDVDVLVEFDRPTGLFGLFQLQDRLAELLGCPVDLGTVEGLKPRMRRRVQQELVRVA